MTAAAALSLAHAEDSPSTTDRAFVAMVSQGGMFEVKAVQVAADKGNTQDLKDQGVTEAHDHQLVGDKLKWGDIHAKDGAAFAKESTAGTNSALKAFASEMHRIVLRHIGELSAIGPK
jgi:putative membrane protein